MGKELVFHLGKKLAKFGGASPLDSFERKRYLKRKVKEV